jgi:hypothetical protein
MNENDIIQSISFEFSSLIKKNLNRIKKISPSKQRQLGNLMSDFKDGLDILTESNIYEGKKYDIGSGYMGNGLTVWNRAEEENDSYKTIAHISSNGDMKIHDKQLPSDIKKMLQKWAISMKKGNRGPIY